MATPLSPWAQRVLRGEFDSAPVRGPNGEMGVVREMFTGMDALCLAMEVAASQGRDAEDVVEFVRGGMDTLFGSSGKLRLSGHTRMVQATKRLFGTEMAADPETPFGKTFVQNSIMERWNHHQRKESMPPLDEAPRASAETPITKEMLESAISSVMESQDARKRLRRMAMPMRHPSHHGKMHAAHAGISTRHDSWGNMLTAGPADSALNTVHSVFGAMFATRAPDLMNSMKGAYEEMRKVIKEKVPNNEKLLGVLLKDGPVRVPGGVFIINYAPYVNTADTEPPPLEGVDVLNSNVSPSIVAIDPLRIIHYISSVQLNIVELCKNYIKVCSFEGAHGDGAREYFSRLVANCGFVAAGTVKWKKPPGSSGNRDIILTETCRKVAYCILANLLLTPSSSLVRLYNVLHAEGFSTVNPGDITPDDHPDLFPITDQQRNVLWHSLYTLDEKKGWILMNEPNGPTFRPPFFRIVECATLGNPQFAHEAKTEGELRLCVLNVARMVSSTAFSVTDDIVLTVPDKMPSNVIFTPFLRFRPQNAFSSPWIARCAEAVVDLSKSGEPTCLQNAALTWLGEMARWRDGYVPLGYFWPDDAKVVPSSDIHAAGSARRLPEKLYWAFSDPPATWKGKAKQFAGEQGRMIFRAMLTSSIPSRVSSDPSSEDLPIGAVAVRKTIASYAFIRLMQEDPRASNTVRDAAAGRYPMEFIKQSMDDVLQRTGRALGETTTAVNKEIDTAVEALRPAYAEFRRENPDITDGDIHKMGDLAVNTMHQETRNLEEDVRKHGVSALRQVQQDIFAHMAYASFVTGEIFGEDTTYASMVLAASHVEAMTRELQIPATVDALRTEHRAAQGAVDRLQQTAGADLRMASLMVNAAGSAGEAALSYIPGGSHVSGAARTLAEYIAPNTRAAERTMEMDTEEMRIDNDRVADAGGVNKADRDTSNAEVDVKCDGFFGCMLNAALMEVAASLAVGLIVTMTAKTAAADKIMGAVERTAKDITGAADSNTAAAAALMSLRRHAPRVAGVTMSLALGGTVGIPLAVGGGLAALVALAATRGLAAYTIGPDRGQPSRFAKFVNLVADLADGAVTAATYASMVLLGIHGVVMTGNLLTNLAGGVGSMFGAVDSAANAAKLVQAAEQAELAAIAARKAADAAVAASKAGVFSSVWAWAIGPGAGGAAVVASEMSAPVVEAAAAPVVEAVAAPAASWLSFGFKPLLIASGAIVLAPAVTIGLRALVVRKTTKAEIIANQMLYQALRSMDMGCAVLSKVRFASAIVGATVVLPFYLVRVLISSSLVTLATWLRTWKSHSLGLAAVTAANVIETGLRIYERGRLARAKIRPLVDGMLSEEGAQGARELGEQLRNHSEQKMLTGAPAGKRGRGNAHARKPKTSNRAAGEWIRCIHGLLADPTHDLVLSEILLSIQRQLVTKALPAKDRPVVLDRAASVTQGQNILMMRTPKGAGLTALAEVIGVDISK